MSSLTHGKQITIDTYYEGKIVGTKHEYETTVFTDNSYLLKQIIELLGTLTRGETNKLNLELKLDGKGRYRLTSRWVA